MNLKIKLLNPNTKFSRGTTSSAGLDVHIHSDVLIYPGLNKIPLGFATEFDPGYFGLISIEKSSKAGFILTAGLIDSDYRGEWILCLHHIEQLNYNPTIHRGVKICQIIFLPVVPITYDYVTELNETERKGGFGSTGVK